MNPLEYLVGQQTAKDVVADSIACFRKNGKPIPTYLLDWPPGYGKNEFHLAVAGTMGVNPRVFKIGDGIKAFGQFLFDTVKMSPNALVLLNEAQSLKSKKMVDPVLDLLEARTFTYRNGTILSVDQMSFMLATTQGWLIPPDVRSRITANLPLIPYLDEEMNILLCRFCPAIKQLDSETREALVRLTMGEPRRARLIAECVSAKLEVESSIDLESVCRSLSLHTNGLTTQDMQILEFVSQSFRDSPGQASSSEISIFLRIHIQAVPFYMERLIRLNLVKQNANYIWEVTQSFN